ncbi:MAG: molybdenum cofactor biosynthesis protein MoaE [Verrucomicrobiota bacterium]
MTTPEPRPGFSGSISRETVAQFETRLPPSCKHGADLRFHGVVRDSEDGRGITGIDYSHYEAMAEGELHRIGAAMLKEFPDHLAMIHHQIGFVPVGTASILIRIQTAHSAAAFAICHDYLRRIKETVPIWKKPIFIG